MGRECRKCHEQFELSGPSSFAYDGLTFLLSAAGLKCQKCLRKAMIERYEESCKGLVVMKEGRLEVDWNLYREKYRKFQAEAKGEFGYKIDMILSVLLSLRILSSRMIGYWDIVVPGVICFVPKLIGICLCFTKERFAVGYAEAMLKGTVVSWEIKQI